MEVIILCSLFVALFASVGVSKLWYYDFFVMELKQSPLIRDYAHTTGWAIPVMELVIAVMLVIPPLRSIGLYAFSVLMALFTVYVIAILGYGDIPCACEG